MEANFQQCLSWVLQSEGGNDDDPQDHGGRTSRGITQREYDAYCARHGSATSDVWSATNAVISNIYYDDYWLPYCSSLPSGADYVFFDTRVNAGTKQATLTLQRALGIAVDGRFGPLTAQAAADEIPSAIIARMSELRRQFYRSLSQFPRYGKGWISRVDFCERNALTLIGG